MAKEVHTQETWRAEKCDDGRWMVCTDGDVIAFRLTEANARLIAAAPDLLALAFQYRDDLKYPPVGDSRVRRLEAIEAALSKANPTREE